ncbi:hypothetical protein AGMMS49959_15270 [Planctomycetales bacterium]|nr:hypothetical protein AGMMS49959_15270 [Planctomycetales bacterium]
MKPAEIQQIVELLRKEILQLIEQSNKNALPKKLMTVAEFAKHKRVTERTVYRWIAEGILSSSLCRKTCGGILIDVYAEDAQCLLSKNYRR